MNRDRLANTYPETVTVEQVSPSYGGGKCEIRWDGVCALGMPPMEYTIKPGDAVTVYWHRPDGLSSYAAVRVNGGPLVFNDHDFWTRA